jgi:hypothetical protein
MSCGLSVEEAQRLPIDNGYNLSSSAKIVRSEGLKRIERGSIPFQREADSFGRLLLLREQHTADLT